MIFAGSEIAAVQRREAERMGAARFVVIVVGR